MNFIIILQYPISQYTEKGTYQMKILLQMFFGEIDFETSSSAKPTVSLLRIS